MAEEFKVVDNEEPAKSGKGRIQVSLLDDTVVAFQVEVTTFNMHFIAFGTYWFINISYGFRHVAVSFSFCVSVFLKAYISYKKYLTGNCLF